MLHPSCGIVPSYYICCPLSRNGKKRGHLPGSGSNRHSSYRQWRRRFAIWLLRDFAIWLLLSNKFAASARSLLAVSGDVLKGRPCADIW